MADSAIGLVGTGRMGTAMCKRLIETGHTVTVWNRTADRTKACVEAGARLAGSPAELVAAAPVILSSLTDHAALSEVFSGPGGLLAADVGGRSFIEMSTILPDEQQALASEVRGRGARYIECPVGGTVAPALKGQLLGLAGGAPEDFEQVKPILLDLCKRVDLLGEIGAGSSMKLAVNLPLAIYWSVLGESLNLLADDGLSGQQIVSILADSSAGPNVLKNRADVVAATIDGTDQHGTFDLNGFHKDLTLALRWAEKRGKKMPITEIVRDTYAEAIAAGLGTFDGATIARFVRSRA